MCVVAGLETGVKIAQKILKVKDDGILGNITVKALNNHNESSFVISYDNECIEHFKKISLNSNLAGNYTGWVNRIARIHTLENEYLFKV